MLAVYAARMLARNLSTSARSVSACLPSVSAALWTWLIVSGGFNIFPREVEDVLSQHADVAMVAVVGVPDDKWGEAVTAIVVAREGARPDADELINLVKARKGSAHAPKHIRFVKELPMTGVGKVDKKALKASFWAGRERMVG